MTNDRLGPLNASIERETRQSAPTVLFFTDNGIGLGHLTRLMAVALQARGRFQPVFLTMSLGYQLLREAKIPSEYFPAYHLLGLSKADWLPLLSMRLAEAVEQVRARIVVVDHVLPPPIFQEVRSSVPGVQFVWSRRGLWRKGKNERALELAKAFDVVIEPGDLAGPIDNGASATHSDGVLSIRPIVLVQPDEYLTRDEARRALGIPSDGRAILLNVNDTSSEPLSTLIEHVERLIRNAAGDEVIHLFAPLHPLHGNVLAANEGLIVAPVYPVARHFNAFDGVVSTAGYNSFHEIVSSGLPAVFVAHMHTNVDDQERRARFAELSGRAFWAPSVRTDAFRRGIERMLVPDEPVIASTTARELGAMTGAAEFAEYLATTVGRTYPGVSKTAGRVDEEEAVRATGLKIRSGENLLHTIPSSSEVVLLSAVEHETLELVELAVEVAALQSLRPQLTPVFLTGKGSPRVLVERSFAFESVMSRSEWSLVGLELDYSGYLRQRAEGMKSRYGTDQLIETIPGQPVANRIPVGD